MNTLDRLIDRLADQHTRSSRIEWAAVMLARDVHTCESILLGRPAKVGRLDPVALRRAIAPPPPDTYLKVTAEMLEVIADGGPFS